MGMIHEHIYQIKFHDGKSVLIKASNKEDAGKMITIACPGRIIEKILLFKKNADTFFKE